VARPTTRRPWARGPRFWLLFGGLSVAVIFVVAIPVSHGCQRYGGCHAEDRMPYLGAVLAGLGFVAAILVAVLAWIWAADVVATRRAGRRAAFACRAKLHPTQRAGTLVVSDDGIAWLPGPRARLRHARALRFGWDELGGVRFAAPGERELPFRGAATATIQLVHEPWVTLDVLRSEELELALQRRIPVHVEDR
jgi:hypothetical protein